MCNSITAIRKNVKDYKGVTSDFFHIHSHAQIQLIYAVTVLKYETPMFQKFIV